MYSGKRNPSNVRSTPKRTKGGGGSKAKNAGKMVNLCFTLTSSYYLNVGKSNPPSTPKRTRAGGDSSQTGKGNAQFYQFLIPHHSNTNLLAPGLTRENFMHSCIPAIFGFSMALCFLVSPNLGMAELALLVVSHQNVLMSKACSYSNYFDTHVDSGQGTVDSQRWCPVVGDIFCTHIFPQHYTQVLV